jgi:hypothetical protein
MYVCRATILLRVRQCIRHCIANSRHSAKKASLAALDEGKLQAKDQAKKDVDAWFKSLP